MTARGENGWQSEKTLVECMRYMLDNEIATDVCFEVGPPDGATVNIRAHKFMLISRSAVFEAMFSSGMTECRSGLQATIRIEDIDAAIFKDLLLYIYSEVVSANVETAASLMYAAKKYMLPKLVRECGECLSQNLTVNNVIQVLEQSSLFDDHELKSKCLQLIEKNAKVVLTGTEIQTASRQTVESILTLDTLPVKEIVVYESCLSWAKHQLLIQRSTENPTDQQIREMLGDLLFKIRFPTMELTKFAEISENRNVLTGEEKASVYYFLATRKKSSHLMFPTERRIPEEVWIERTVNCVSGQWRSASTVDAINFTVDHNILLTGIGLYTGYNGAVYDVDVEILQSTNSLFKKKFTVTSTRDENQFKVPVNEPISVNAGVAYTVTALPHGDIGHYGQQCQAVRTKDKVTFSFSQCHVSLGLQKQSTTTPIYGQIPRFYFCC